MAETSITWTTEHRGGGVIVLTAHERDAGRISSVEVGNVIRRLLLDARATGVVIDLSDLGCWLDDWVGYAAGFAIKSLGFDRVCFVAGNEAVENLRQSWNGWGLEDRVPLLTDKEAAVRHLTQPPDTKKPGA